jgi:hypothetical protein
MDERHVRITRLIMDPDGAATEAALTGGTLHVERTGRGGMGPLRWRVEMMGTFPGDMMARDTIPIEVWEDGGRRSRGMVLIRRQTTGTGRGYVSLTGSGPLERA